MAISSDGFTETSTYLVANPAAFPSLGTESTPLTNTTSSAGVTLYSTGSNKSLVAGGGADVMIGAPGDKLTGGTGADTFVFNPKFGKETITNFNVNQDVLAFDHNLFANPTASQVLSQTHDTNAGAVIKVDAHDTVTLTGVTVAQLQSHLSDFHFF
jgi:fibronectin-binding autotransporter adhesin